MMRAHIINNSIPCVQRGNERVPEIVQTFFTGRSTAVNRMGSLTVASYGGKNRGIGRRIQGSLVYSLLPANGPPIAAAQVRCMLKRYTVLVLIRKHFAAVCASRVCSYASASSFRASLCNIAVTF